MHWVNSYFQCSVPIFHFETQRNVIKKKKVVKYYTLKLKLTNEWFLISMWISMKQIVSAIQNAETKKCKTWPILEHSEKDIRQHLKLSLLYFE